MEENLVKQVCKEYDLTLNELAEKIDIPRGTIGRWVSVDTMPKTAELALKFMLKNKELEDKLETMRLFKKILNEL